MICQSCRDQAHDVCVDVVRKEGWVQWMRKAFKGVTIGQKEKVTIEANRPYGHCFCQHKTDIPQKVVFPQG